MEEDRPSSSLPSNYVTILHLKQQWLLKQQQSDSHPTLKPKDDSASKTPNDVVVSPRRTNPHRPIINQPKPDVKPIDSGSKTTNDVVRRGKMPYRVNNQPEPEVSVLDSASKAPSDVVGRGRKPYRVNNQPEPKVTEVETLGNHAMVEHQTDQSNSKTQNGVVSVRKNNHHRAINQLKPDVAPHDSGSKTTNDVVPRGKMPYRVIPEPEAPVPDSASKTVVETLDNHEVVEKQEDKKTHQSNSRKKNSSRGRNPRSVTNQIPETGSTKPLEPEPEPEPVKDKKQHRDGGRRNRKKGVREDKGETTPCGQNVDESLDNGSGGGGMVEAVAAAAAAAVKEVSVTNVSQRITRRYDSGIFDGGRRYGDVKPRFGVQKGQMSMVWVKKGESSLN